jgi:hypothetical protein
VFKDDVLPQIFQTHSLQLFQDALREVCRVFTRQRAVSADVRDVRQDFQAVAAGGRDGGIGPGRGHEINRRVIGQFVALEDLREMLLLMAAEEKVVMREWGILAIKAQSITRPEQVGSSFFQNAMKVLSSPAAS